MASADSACKLYIMIKHAIIGTGSMGAHHVLRMREVPGVEIVAGCDITADRVNAFCDKHGIAGRFTSVEAMLETCDFDSVSIVTTDATHAQLSILAAQAGKHILCEKPLATSVADAEAMVAAVRTAGVINMVNFSYRDASATQKAAQIVRSGQLGEIYHVEAHYLQSWLTAKDWGDWQKESQWLWRCSTEHGSNGVLGDVGVHILDFASFPVGDITRLTARLKTFDKYPPTNRIGEYTLDANDSVLMMAEFAGGAIGTINATRMATGHQNSLALSIHGEKGAVRIDLDRAKNMIEISMLDEEGKNQPWESIYCGKTPNNYQRFVTSVETGVNDQPDFARGLAVQRLLEAASLSSERGTAVEVPQAAAAAAL